MVSIIIVSYNTKQFVIECIRSIYLWGTKNIEIIVVDNASSDSIEKSMQEFPDVKFIHNEKNYGYSKANNIGVHSAKGEFILFLNPDTVVQKNTIGHMLSFMQKHTDAGVATCKVVLPTGQLDDACHRGFPTPWNAFCHFSGLSQIFSKSRLFDGYSLGFMDLSKTHEVDACAGAFMMVRKNAGEEVDWWDEDFFWYGEDLDFCYRVKQKGWKVYYVPDVSIMHYKGVSGGIKSSSKEISTASSQTRVKATHARFEAMKIFYKKHYSDKYPKILTWLVMKAIDIKQNVTLKTLQFCFF